MVPSVTFASTFNVENFSEDEELIASRSFADFQRHVLARLALDIEEDVAAQSTRPTVALHPIGPWR